MIAFFEENRDIGGEPINGLFKAAVIHRRGPWRSFDAVEYATLE
ncbi:Mobile element protein [Candidatus Rhodobacter oscarellae]|uniref:Mobile element protein n=1 Tax=Candidatus Rhodobacter oscarellae TaxID=1675527 RepID=A0A0J9EE06_9RHOB|nr:Mobile element protein [Candidatus Rhodobacter lobularis]